MAPSTTAREGQGLLFSTIAVVILASQPTLAAKRASWQRITRIEWAKSCDEPNNSLECYSIRQRMYPTGSIGIDGDCHFSRGVTAWHSFDINITKCQDVESTNTCEYFQTWRFPNDACAVMNAPNMLWTDFFDRVRPRLRCPIKPGNYSAYDVHLDPEKFKALPLPFDNTIWIVKLLMFERAKVLHACLNFALRLLRVRRGGV